MIIKKQEFQKQLLYPYMAVAAGLAFALVTGSAHWGTLNFNLTALTALSVVTVFDRLILSSLDHDQMTPSRFLFRTMVVVITMQAAFAGIYYFAADPTTYLARDGKPITDFVDALYFSGVTLLTVGYGDIVPVGDFRFTAIAEVYGGTLFIFSFFSWGLSAVAQRHYNRTKS